MAGCQCVQVFTKNGSQWKAKDITEEEAQRFRLAFKDSGLKSSVAHDSYLINLAPLVDHAGGARYIEF